MEVHHHSHHPKKWKEYFWEFFMLFLAVFCGFLAEIQVEHYVEHQREKQYIKSFIEDLKSDTASISNSLNYRQIKLSRLDSLIDLLANNKIKGYEKDIYYFGRILIRGKVFQTNDRTITQLKNSGGLRLIQNEAAADSIIAYQKLVEEIANNESFERTERYNSYPVLARLLSPYVLDKMVDKEGITRLIDNPPLRSYNPDLIEDVAFYVHAIKGSLYQVEERLKNLRIKAINTIDFLEKEYHLK